MYSKTVTASQLALASQALGMKLKRHSIAEVTFYNDHFRRLTEFNDKGIAQGWLKSERPNGLLSDELRYITNERTVCKLDFMYFGTRYAHIKNLDKEIVRWAPNVAQLVLLSIWGSAEEKHWAIMLLELKARQLGVTTANMIAIAHRVLFHSATDAIMASSDPAKSRDMADKVELICDLMPWWLMPRRTASQTGGLIEFNDLKSKLNIFWGNQKQGLARGSTPGVVHLSEVADFEDAEEKIDNSLLNAIHEHHTTFFVMEGTGKGKGDNYLYKKWNAVTEMYPQGRSRIRPLFLPVYVGEKDLYPTSTWLQMHPIPHNWQPQDVTFRYRDAAHSYVANEPLLQDALGINWKMSRKHMWRWEFQRDAALKAGNLSGFLQEWAASASDSFQAPFSNVFGGELIYEIQQQQPVPVAVFGIEGPADEINPYIHLFQNEIDTTKAPITVRPQWLDSLTPPEYRLVPLLLHGYPSTFSPIGKLLLYEWPQDDEEYGIGVDPSYGKGKDNSAIEALRNRTFTKPDAQVAEFASPLLDSHGLWPYIAAIAEFLTVMRNGNRQQPRLAIEMAANGQEVQRELKDRGYWNFHTRVPDDAKVVDYNHQHRIGFETTKKSRPKVTQGLEHAIKDRSFVLNSPWLLEECGGVIWNADKQRLEAGYGATDDRYMASGIIRESFRQTETPSMRVYAHAQKTERDAKANYHPVFRKPDQSRDVPSEWLEDHAHDFDGILD
jgi:hypothetical protein